jgi:UbiD family decarboxylase
VDPVIAETLGSHPRCEDGIPTCSLRDFLAHLEQHGQLLRIRHQVAPDPDLGAAGRAISGLGEDTPALLFENIHGYDERSFT